MPTPQITLRVSKERHLRWKQAAALVETSVSEQIRDEMDNWAAGVLGDREGYIPLPNVAVDLKSL